MKHTETVRAKDAPAVSEHLKRKADSIACTYGAELFTLGWIAGLLSAFFGGAVPAAAAALLLSAVLMLLRKRRMLRGYLRICAGLLLGLALWTGYDLAVRQPLCALDGTEQICTGTVTDSEQLRDGRVRYTLRTKLAGHRVSTDWYASAETPRMQAGDTVKLNAALTRIQPDYRYHTAAYQAGRGRYLRIYDAELLETVPQSGFSLRRAVQAYRQRMTHRIRAALPAEEAGLFCAMLFGDKTLLSDEAALGLNRTGVGHIAVVSGLHLVLFCAAVGWLLKLLHCPARPAFLMQIPAILLFILLVDASVAVWRAAVMVLLAGSAVLFGRHRDPLRAICLAAILCTAFAPYVIGSVSFWLSFSAVLGIGVIAPYMTRHMKCGGTLRLLLQYCCLTVAVFPASVLLCGESSLTAPLCNLVILPFCTVTLCIGFAFLLTGGVCGFLLPSAGMLCRFVLFVTEKLSTLPFSHVTVSAPAMRLILILCTAALAVLLLCRAKPRVLVTAAVFAAMLLSLEHLLLTWLSRGTLQIAVLGGKQSAVLVISAENRTVVADLTDTPRSAQYVQRYLRDAGISQIDVMLLRSTRTAAAYQAELTAVRCGTVLLQSDEPLDADTRLLGAEPVRVSAGCTTVRCGDAEIAAEDDALRVTWNGMTLLAAKDAALSGNAAAVRYGKEGCTVQLSTDPPLVYSENNLRLRLTESGGGSIERLMKTP